ncbi:hypothetical protein [Chitinophaga sp. RAB17]|uniref:hypothetical protein n=1 Tax=Chitinophaga sp. RAB17 TaxID=3233049 RepID=UPI003F9217F3
MKRTPISLLLLLILAFTGQAQSTAQKAEACRIDITGVKESKLVFIDANKGLMEDPHGNLVSEFGKLPFPMGNVIIHNKRNQPTGIRIGNAADSSMLTTPPIVIAPGGEIVFNFIAGGKVQADPVFGSNVNGKLVENLFIVYLADSADRVGTSISLKEIRKGARGSRHENNGSREVDSHSGKGEEKNEACESCGLTDFKYSKSLVYYDFSCKSFYRLKKDSKGDKLEILNLSKYKLWPRQAFQLKIVNVNRYLYEVKIEGTDVHYESEMPPLFRAIFTGDSTGLLGTLLNSLSSNLPKSMSANPGFSGQVDQFESDLATFFNNYNELRALRLNAFYLCNKFPCCGENEIGQSYEEFITSLFNLRLSLSHLQRVAKEETPVQQQALADKQAVLKACTDLAKRIADNQKKLAAETDSAKRVPLEAEISTDRGNLCNQPNLSQEIVEIEQSLAAYKNVAALQTTLPSDEDLEFLYLFVHNIRKQNNEFLTPPIYATGNRLELIITVKPWDTSFVTKKAIMPLYYDSSYADMPVLGRPFFSFSSGSFMAIERYMQNKTYDWQPVSGDSNVVSGSSKYRLVESGYSLPVMGFAALANIEWKFGASIGAGFSAGAGLTIETSPRICYLGGASVFFGDVRQLALTAGLAATQVNRLKSNYEAMATQKILYDTKPAGAEYFKELKAGGFISLTYTPFSGSRKSLFRAATKKN